MYRKVKNKEKDDKVQRKKTQSKGIGKCTDNNEASAKLRILQLKPDYTTQVLYHRTHGNEKGKKTYTVGGYATFCPLDLRVLQMLQGSYYSQAVHDFPLPLPWTSLVVVSMILARRARS